MKGVGLRVDGLGCRVLYASPIVSTLKSPWSIKWSSNSENTSCKVARAGRVKVHARAFFIDHQLIRLCFIPEMTSGPVSHHGCLHSVIRPAQHCGLGGVVSELIHISK